MSSAPLPAPGPSHRGTWLGLALGSVALHLVALTRYGWFRDEFYYVACARHLAWGYVDQPPLSIAVLALVRALFGESLVALRLTVVLAGGLTVYLVARLAREVGGGRFAQALAALTVLLAPVFVGESRYYSMNAFDLLLWTGAASALVSALRRARTRDWLALGVMIGLGLLNKISMLWFSAGLFAGLLITSHRRQLLQPGPWLAGAVAIAMFAPHVAWQIGNGWPTLEFMRNASSHKMVAVSIPGFLLGQFLTMGPANALVYLPGLAFALLAPSGRPWRILAVMFLSVAAVLVSAGTSRASYLAAAYPMLLALGGAAWEQWTARRPRLLRAALIAVVALLGLPLVPMALPILPVETFIRYQAALGLQPSTEERTRVGPLPQHYADMFGWDELVDLVARAYQKLTPEERAHAVVFGQNYGEAGAVDVLGPRRGLPRAISGHNSYYLWGPGSWDGRVLIIIGGDEPDNAAWFDSLERVGTWDAPYAMPYERGLGIFIGRGFRYPPKEAWPKLKHFI
jgi:hypothetical protein